MRSLLRRYAFWYDYPRSRRQDYIALLVMVAAPLLASGLVVALYTSVRHLIR